MATGRTVSFGEVLADDFEELAELRIEAMRESLERLDRFDPERARERLSRSFYPEHTRWIMVNGKRVGFYALRPLEGALYLDHMYVRPDCQSQGLGSVVMARLTALADEKRLPIYVAALRESPANRFYQRHGFEQTREEEWDIYYVRGPVAAQAAEASESL